MKLSDYTADFLSENGVTHVFGYAGGAITHIVDSLYKKASIEFISTYHEQAAAFAAEGYARIKNDLGVAIATSGPGATNLITGIGSAFFDSVPCLYITGQVNTFEYRDKKQTGVRQLGFQETDIVRIVKPFTKYAARIENPAGIAYELQKAVFLARNGRKGPVLLDIPMDVQRADIDVAGLKNYKLPSSLEGICDVVTAVHDTISCINQSSRPVILAGGGIRTAGAAELLTSFAKKTKIPVVSSLMGLDACDPALENYMGLIGVYGNRYGNLALANCDLILALGSRLDSRQTGTNPGNFAREAQLIRVDIDRHEMKRRLKEDEMQINTDLFKFLKMLNSHALDINIKVDPWLDTVKKYKARYPAFSEARKNDPNYFIHMLSGLIGSNSIITLDVGQNQMWAAQAFGLKSGQRLLTSGGMGAMGFSLPAAIGAWYASPSSSIIAFCGDGGFQMNIQELQLLKRNSIPVKIIIMNNGCLGMIRHFQEMYFEGRYHGTVNGYSAPDFRRIADAYGIANAKHDSDGKWPDTEKLLNESTPAVIDVKLPQTTYTYPKLAVNKPIEDQEPLLPRDELSSNMLIDVWSEPK